MYPNSSESNIYIFSAVGILIILIACINFMNLATARSAKRAREVGMRKVLGADRFMLIKQFLGESLLLSFFAVIVSILLIELLMPVFNNLAGNNFHLNFYEPSITFVINCCSICRTFVRHISCIFSFGCRSNKSSKGGKANHPKGGLLRKGL